MPLLEAGDRAMSVDLRDAEHDGPHFKGDFRQVVYMKYWDAAYFVGPNCYQFLAGDINCLDAKIADCRAYWGAARVLWCICFRWAKMSVVEQPNTIGHKYFPLEQMPGVKVMEFSTTQYGDKKHKFVRLTLVRATIAEPTFPRDEAAMKERRPHHMEYESEEARDRARSTFLPYTNTCAAIAAATPTLETQGGVELTYEKCVASFGRNWLYSHKPLPPGWDNPSGGPLDAESRAYQTQRGHGDGRRPRAAVHELPSMRSRTENASGWRARRAEGGDQVLASDPIVTTLKLIDRELQRVGCLKPALEVRYSLLQHDNHGIVWLAATPGATRTDDVGSMLNWAALPFTDPLIKGGAFAHVEQYFQFAKAVFAQDESVAEAIRNEESAPGCLMRGRALTSLDKAAWDALAPYVAERAVWLKFAQNGLDRQGTLLATGRKKIVYANDDGERVWGIGLSQKAALETQRLRWGENRLGKVLMRVRLRMQYGMESTLPRTLARSLASMGMLRDGPPRKEQPAGVHRNARSIVVQPPPEYSRNIWPALRALDKTLRPSEEILDCGGAGRCGNNSIAVALSKASFEQVSGQAVRDEVVAHAEALVQASYVFSKGPGREGDITTEYLLGRSLGSWPTNANRADLCTAQEWIDKMRVSTTWVDGAFLAIAADKYRVRIKYYAVNADGTLSHTGYIEPSDDVQPRGVIKLALVIEQHYSAIVPTGCGDENRPPGYGPTLPEQRDVPDYPHGLLDTALIPTASQLLMAIEDSMESARYRACAASTEKEAQELLEALHRDALVTPSTKVLEAMRASGEEADKKERAQLEAALEESRRVAQRRAKRHQPSAEDTDESGCRNMGDEPYRRDDDADPGSAMASTSAPGAGGAGGGVEAMRDDTLYLDSDDELDSDFFNISESDLESVAPIESSRRADLVNPNLQAAAPADVPSVEPPAPGDLGPVPCDECEHGFQEPACENDPPTCSAWYCSRGGPPCYGGSPHPCNCNDADQHQSSTLEAMPAQMRAGAEGATDDAHPLAQPAEMDSSPSGASKEGSESSNGNESDEPISVQALEAKHSQPRCGRVSFAATPVEEAIERIAEGSINPWTALIVPLTVERGEIAVLIPSEEEYCFGLQRGARAAEPIVDKCVAAVQRGSTNMIQAIGFNIGISADGAKMVGVATRITRSVAIARTQCQRVAAMSCGATAVWCLLTALARETIQHSRAAVAVAAASHFVTYDFATTSILKAESRTRKLAGMQAGRTEYQAPARPVLNDKGETTPRALVEWSQVGLDQLKNALLKSGDPYLELWADSAQPIKLNEHSSELLDRSLHLRDERLGQELFAPMLPIYETPWLPRMPSQMWEERVGCEGFRPSTALDLLQAPARRRLHVWFEKARKDAICLEREGADCDRSGRPPTIAIGQSQVVACARDYIWDCRQKPCKLLDFHQQMNTDFNLEYLRGRLRSYPDQRLASNILEGIRFEADLELTAVLSAQLISAGIGYESVQKTVRELEEMDFYDFFDNLPFWPIVVVAQGSVIKKLGVKKYRRTSDFSGPHKETLEETGRRAMSINEASKSYEIPTWIANSRQTDVQEWARHKYEHVPKRGDVAASVRHKFPKEHKPALSDVLRDASILGFAALEMNEPIFAFLEDAAYYFSQFGYSPEELWKSNLILNAREGDFTAAGAALMPGQLVFISEKRLGFGSFASSNIAQRFSNALTGWTLEVFDRLEQEAKEKSPDPQWEAWIRKRAPLEAKCREERPKKAGEALTDCKQTRLAAMHMFTDDPTTIVVGVDRTLRMLAAWREVTESINLQVADHEKRQLGCEIEWIGVCLLVGIGLVSIPGNKLLRARDAIRRTLQHETTFGEYRALVGLLEHLRFVAQLQADATNSLYRPHKRDGESKDGPATVVRPTALMRSSLEAWLQIIMSCAGAEMTIVFTESAEARMYRATAVVAASSDAAGDGRGKPGMGGYCHGFYWRIHLPSDILSIMHITAWETLAAAVNILVTARLAGKEATLALQVDALLTPYVISKQKSKSENVQSILQKLLSDSEYTNDIAWRLVLRHLSGDGNVPSDLASRALWQELTDLCRLLRVRPVCVHLTQRERDFVMAVVQEAAGRREKRVTRSAIQEMFQTPPLIGAAEQQAAAKAKLTGCKRERAADSRQASSKRASEQLGTGVVNNNVTAGANSSSPLPQEAIQYMRRGHNFGRPRRERIQPHHSQWTWRDDLEHDGRPLRMFGDFYEAPVEHIPESTSVLVQSALAPEAPDRDDDGLELRSARRIREGEVVACYGDGVFVSQLVWRGLCQREHFPETWGAFVVESERHLVVSSGDQARVEPMVAMDDTWETNRDPTLPRPRWTYIQHSRRQANLRLERDGPSIQWVAKWCLPAGTVFFYDYGGYVKDLQDDPASRVKAADRGRAEIDKNNIMPGVVPESPGATMGPVTRAGARLANLGNNRAPPCEMAKAGSAATFDGILSMLMALQSRLKCCGAKRKPTGKCTKYEEFMNRGGDWTRDRPDDYVSGDELERFYALNNPALASNSASPLAQEAIQYFIPLWADKSSGSAPASATHVSLKVNREQTRRAPASARSRLRLANRHTAHPYHAPAYGSSRLRTDEVHHAKSFAQRLHRDTTAGRIDAPLDVLEEMALAVAEARNDGTNPRTASKDAFALREFEAFAELRGFDPNLRSEWARKFPERESLKMAAFLLFRAQRSVPRSKKSAVSKPMSIYQNYLALRRVFRARNVELTPSGAVRDTLRGLLRRFVRRYGVEALRPQRVEPVTPQIVQKAVDLAQKGTAVVNGRPWRIADWTTFIVLAWMVVNLSVGSRKGESTKLPGDVDGNDWFTHASLSLESQGRVYVDPPETVWRSLTEGDLVFLANNGSKCDAYGTQHGTEPIVLPYHDDPLNAAKWVRDVVLRSKHRGKARKDTPLFADEHGSPFTDAAFGALIKHALVAVVGKHRAQLLSPHSWRVWLASSLRMCNATDARIQAMGRWLNPDSIKIYARMTKQEYAGWVDKLMRVKRIDTARTTSLPVMDMADAIAVWGDQLKVDGTNTLETWETQAPVDAKPPPSQISKGERISVYWTELGEWYTGTFTSSRVEPSDGGGMQRASRVVYDAVGPWAKCTTADLTYWHCLDDEQWHRAGDDR